MTCSTGWYMHTIVYCLAKHARHNYKLYIYVNVQLKSKYGVGCLTFGWNVFGADTATATEEWCPRGRTQCSLWLISTCTHTQILIAMDVWGSSVLAWGGLPPLPTLWNLVKIIQRSMHPSLQGMLLEELHVWVIGYKGVSQTVHRYRAIHIYSTRLCYRLKSANVFMLYHI